MSEAPDGHLSLQEMAEALGVSVPTLRRLLRRYPDFPVVSRGSNGVAFRFDREAVLAFVRAKRAEEEASRAQRDALLGRIALPPEITGEGEEAAPSADDRLKHARAMLAETELAASRGVAVPVRVLHSQMAEILGDIMRFVMALPREMERRHQLPAPVVNDMQRLFEGRLRSLHRDLSSSLSPHGEAADEP